MADVVIKKRVDRLETLMRQLIVTVNQTDQQLARTDEQLARTDEQLARTDEQLERTDRQMERTQHRLDQLSAEMREFKEEMRASWERSKQETRKLREEFYEKLGTLAEDLVAPSIPRIIHRITGCPNDGLTFLGVRVKRWHPVRNNQQEYDVVAMCGDYLFINETKRKLGADDVKEFAGDVLPQAREFFPEYAEKKIIGAIASLYVDDSLVRYGERQGLFVLGAAEELMEVLNEPGFVPKYF